MATTIKEKLFQFVFLIITTIKAFIEIVLQSQINQRDHTLMLIHQSLNSKRNNQKYPK